MSKVVRSTLRLNDLLDFKIKLLAKRNNLSENSMKEYLLELGIETYLDKYDSYFQQENCNLLEGLEGDD